MIEFKCDKCGTQFKVGDAAAGKMATCQKCMQRVRIPTEPSTDQSPVQYVTAELVSDQKPWSIMRQAGYSIFEFWKWWGSWGRTRKEVEAWKLLGVLMLVLSVGMLVKQPFTKGPPPPQVWTAENEATSRRVQAIAADRERTEQANEAVNERQRHDEKPASKSPARGFSKIRYGMSQYEVIDLMGDRAKILSTGEDLSGESELWAWQDGSTIYMVTFLEGEVVASASVDRPD